MAGLYAKKLTLAQAEEIYEEYLKADFPKDEIKPFLTIRKMWDRKSYYAYGFYEENASGEASLCAYAFLMADHGKRMLLLDYFAVCSWLRGSGYGSQALLLLRAECAEWNGMVVEVEDNELPGLEEQTKITRRRRIAFYEAAGCRMTTTRSRLWGVDYRIMVMPIMDGKADENAAKKICSVYQGMYESSVLKKHFEITAE